MKVLLLSRDIELKKELEGTECFSEVLIEDKLSKSVDDSDIIIISDSIIPYNELIFNIEQHNVLDNRRVYYMISNNNSNEVINNISWICKSKNIHVVPPKLTTNQIRERIIGDIFPGIKKERNAVTFFGADSKVGTTMTAQSVAENLAQNTNAKIGLLMLHGYRGTEYVKDDNISLGLDNLKVKLINNILTKEELMANCIQKDNLYILPGINNILDVRQYHPEHIEELINLAAQCFNIVIIDAGSCKGLDFSAGITISGLNLARHIYFVTTQQNLPYDLFDKNKNQILDLLQIKTESFYLVVNKYFKTDGILTPDQLAKQYNMTLASYIPNMDYRGWECEFNNSTLLSTNKEYDYEIEQLAKLIARQFEIRYIENSVKKSFIDTLFSKKVRAWK